MRHAKMALLEDGGVARENRSVGRSVAAWAENDIDVRHREPVTDF